MFAMVRTRAAVVDEAGADPVVQDIDLADLIADEVLVRVATTGVCHTDLAVGSGEIFPEYPVILGHESAGVVEAVGPGVTGFAKGDRVGISLTHHCGHCARCEEGHPMLCPTRLSQRPRQFRDGRPLIQAFGTGSFAEKTIVRENSLVKIPDGVSLEIAALLGCAVSTGLGFVWNIAQVQPGTRVAVFGCGGIGANVIMGCAVAGAETIVVIEPSEQRRELALRIGATDSSDSDFERLMSFAPGGFDYVFECVGGRPEVVEIAINATRPGGTAVVVGVQQLRTKLTVPALEFVANQKRLLGGITGDVRPHLDWERYIRLYKRGRLPFDALIGRRLPLDDIVRAFEFARQGEGIRTMVTMD
jgi:S-(hydroxymethyl)glutathione dehydrogenase/alcohol dehydrogenase